MEVKKIGSEKAATWDNAKKKGTDREFVSGQEAYETTNLVDRVVDILKENGVLFYSRVGIRATILNCMTTVPVNHPRQALLECVLKKYHVT